MKRYWLRQTRLAATVTLFLLGSLAANAADSLRYLFLIDHSPEMATRQISTVQTISQIIQSGFENEIKPGEKFALWFYGSRLQTNAPFTWQSGQESLMARQAARLFTGRIYSRLRPREQTLSDAAPLIAASPKITIFIITDGSQPLAGTPYDATINTAIEKYGMALTQFDRPFVITLTARSGNWVDGAVFASVTEPYRIPEFDRRNELMDKALAAVRSAGGAQETKPAGSSDIDKALAAVRKTTLNTADPAEQARAALREALAGNPQSSATPPKMQFSPTLQQAPKEQPKSAEEPKEQKSEPAPAIGADTKTSKTPPPFKELPPTIARPTDADSPSTGAAEQHKQAAAAQTKPPTVEPQKPIESQKAVEQPKPTAQPKPVDQPAAVVDQPKSAEPPKVVQQQKQTGQAVKTVENPKPIEQTKAIAAERPKAPPSVEPTPQRTTPLVSPNRASAGVTQGIAQAKQVAAPHSAPKQAPPVAPLPEATVVSVPQKGFPWPIVVGGFVAIAAGGAVAFRAAKRRAQSPGSLITQALPGSQNKGDRKP